MQTESPKTKKLRPKFEKRRETCSVCGETYLAAYRTERKVCRECQERAARKAYKARKAADRQTKTQRREKNKQKWQEIKAAPRNEFGLLCPYSPDCEKCPLADCKMANAHRYNILETDTFGYENL